MKLLVILLCLLGERYLAHMLSFKRFFWFQDYFSWVVKTWEKRHWPQWGRLILCAIVLPIVLGVLLIFFLTHSLFFGLGTLVAHLLLFFYCLGPKNIFYPENIELSAPVQVEGYFAQVNRELFSVIFWYVVAGPFVALAYRLITLCQEKQPVAAAAEQMTSLMEYAPARITALLYLLVGNFQQGYVSFIKFLLSSPVYNSKMLGECGMQALHIQEGELSLSAAARFVEQALIVSLVVIALFTLAAWL